MSDRPTTRMEHVAVWVDPFVVDTTWDEHAANLAQGADRLVLGAVRVLLSDGQPVDEVEIAVRLYLADGTVVGAFVSADELARVVDELRKDRR
jgi:hypothetical protein